MSILPDSIHFYFIYHFNLYKYIYTCIQSISLLNRIPLVPVTIFHPVLYLFIHRLLFQFLPCYYRIIQLRYHPNKFNDPFYSSHPTHRHIISDNNFFCHFVNTSYCVPYSHSFIFFLGLLVLFSKILLL